MSYKIQHKVTVEHSPEEWELYSGMEGVEVAAHWLNVAASQALSCGDPEQAWKIWNGEVVKWAKYGASDTEPRWHFEHLFNKVYGEGK